LIRLDLAQLCWERFSILLLYQSSTDWSNTSCIGEAALKPLAGWFGSLSVPTVESAFAVRRSLRNPKYFDLQVGWRIHNLHCRAIGLAAHLMPQSNQSGAVFD
jgi:hypothetical protein